MQRNVKEEPEITDTCQFKLKSDFKLQVLTQNKKF